MTLHLSIFGHSVTYYMLVVRLTTNDLWLFALTCPVQTQLLSFWNIQICIVWTPVKCSFISYYRRARCSVITVKRFSKMWTLTHSICCRTNQTCPDSMHKKRLWKSTEGFLDASPSKFTRAKKMSLTFEQCWFNTYSICLIYSGI